MKFSALAFVTVSLSALAEARPRTLGAKAIERSMNSVDKRALLQSARKLQNEEEEDTFEINGHYSVRFNSCVSIALDEEQVEENNKNNNQYQDFGDDAVPMKQMLVIDLVSSNSSIPTQEIAMDIGDYVNTVGSMVYQQVENYCGVCQEIADDCAAQEGNWVEQTKKYFKSDQGSTVEYVDCKTCELYNCNGPNYSNVNQNNKNYNNDDDNKNAEGLDMGSAFNYLEELSQCQAFSVSYQNSEYTEEYEYNEENQYNQDEDLEQNSRSLYIGYRCTEYGTGIELSFFLDQDCTYATYDDDVAENIPETSLAGQYLQMSQNLVNGIFENSFSCNDIEFANPFEAEEQQEEGNTTWYNFQYYGNNAEEDIEIPAANEYCQSIFEEENTMLLQCKGLSSSTSVANSNWMSWVNNFKNDDEANAQNETAVESDDALYDEDDVCDTLRTISKTASKYREHANNIYNSYGTGSSSGSSSSNSNVGQYGEQEQSVGYDYNSFGQYNTENRVAPSSRSTAEILMYIGVAAAIIALIALFASKKKESNEAKKQSLILEGDAGDYKAEGEIA